MNEKESLQKNLEVGKMSRDEKKVIYQQVESIIDVATGEIRSRTTTERIKTQSEPDFIKIYYKSMLAVQGIEELSLDFVLALSSVITYSNDPTSPVFFYNNKANRNIIANYCLSTKGKDKGQPISDNMVSRHIKTAVQMGLLFTTENRGIYEVNPCMIARGKWENIRGLQANFDFVNGKWTRTITTQAQPEVSEGIA